MSSIRTMMGSGLPAASAVSIGGTVADNLTGSGSSSQANSFAIAADVNFFTTLADANAGARLPADFEVGGTVEIFNGNQSTAMKIYPHVGGNINNAATDANIVLSATKGSIFRRINATRWAAVYV